MTERDAQKDKHVGYIRGENEAAATIARVVENLGRSGCFEPLATEPDERRRWQDHDLASMAENRLGVVIDLEKLSDRSRQDLIARTTVDGEGLGALHPEYFRHYWLVDNRQRVGTLAIATSLVGRSLLGISSLYVVPTARGRGCAGRALRAVHTASLAAGLSGIRLSTDWSWQPAVRFYLEHAMWVWGWKRSLDLIWRRDLPTWRGDFDGESARFVVVEGDTGRPIIEARRAGDRLEWGDAADAETERGRALHFLAPGTFALALAVRGFPLITTDAAWQEQLALGFSDCGGPEGLAFKIRLFEAWDRKHGWLTPAPRIPGLDYPDWDAMD